VVAHRPGNADPAGLGERFQACRDIDAVAEDVAFLDNDVAEVDADAELDAPLPIIPGGMISGSVDGGLSPGMVVRGTAETARTRARIDSHAAEPIVRRLSAGGKRIRTLGPA
jgi:hypothetical protein